MDFEEFDKNNSILPIDVEKLNSEYKLFVNELLPIDILKIKVWYNYKTKEYYAYPNVEIVVDKESGLTDIICGIGETEEEALNDCVNRFLALVSYYENKFKNKLMSTDFKYVSTEDF